MRIFTIRTLPFLLVAALQIGARNTDAATIYVNAKATGTAAQDGSSWKTAFASLQDALDKAASTPGKRRDLGGRRDVRADEDLRAT